MFELNTSSNIFNGKLGHIFNQFSTPKTVHTHSFGAKYSLIYNKLASLVMWSDNYNSILALFKNMVC